MSAPAIKLSYFDMAGRAETTRLALAYGNIAYEDKRVAFPDWPALKPTTPLGQLPVMEVDGKVFAQSIAIARYAAKLSGAYPTDALQALAVDMVVDTVNDLVSVLIDILWLEQDETKKAEKSKKLVEEMMPTSFAALEEMVEGGAFFGSSITLADIRVFDFVVSIAVSFPGFDISKFPKIVGVVESVKTNPNIAAYLAKHQK